MAEKEYLSREDVIGAIDAIWQANKNGSYGDERLADVLHPVVIAVEVLPAADVAPVVHGYWKLSEKLETLNMTIYECSACGGQLLPSKAEKSEWINNPRYAYCSYCGARMDGDENDP